jgi:hypothetical protein
MLLFLLEDVPPGFMHAPKRSEVSMKLISAVAILGLSLVSSSFPQTGRLKALIIGNARYLHLNSLEPETANDANRMASVLQAVGVKSSDETVLFDLGKEQLVKAIEQFAQTLQPDDTAIFYFSGHGYSIEGSGFLAPIDIVASDNITKAEAREAGYPLFQLFHQLGRASQRVIILDACRNDPHLEKQVFMDSNGNSFRVTPLKSEEPPVGTIVAFATSAGAKSALGSSDNLSFYTHYLVMNLNGRPATFMEALEKTVSDVAQASKNAQIPALYLEGSPPIVLSQLNVPDVPQGDRNQATIKHDAGMAGTWSGEYTLMPNSGSRPEYVVFDLQQSGTSISGTLTLTTNSEEQSIKGMLRDNGDFDITAFPTRKDPITMVFKGHYSADATSVNGTVEATGTNPSGKFLRFPGTFSLARNSK